MCYKVGQKVRIKSIDWYNENKDINGNVDCGFKLFTHQMSKFCGCTMIICSRTNLGVMIMEGSTSYWTDKMIEGLVDITQNRVDKLACKINEELPFGNPYEWECPHGYIFKDENGNVINTTKIVLEKKEEDKLQLDNTKKVREYWSEYARIFIEIYDNEPNECIFTHLWVVDEQRRKGYGKQALVQAEGVAKELGCNVAYLKVETDSWMHKWYLRCGYKWYKNAPDDYTWLTKNLNNMEKKKKI